MKKSVKKKYSMNCLLMLFCLVILLGCLSCQHRVQEKENSTLDPALLNGMKRYTKEVVYSGDSENADKKRGKRRGKRRAQQWWLSFQDPLLTRYIEEALQSSFTLKQRGARLEQARLAAQQVAAEQYPLLDAKMQGALQSKADNTLDFSENLAFVFSWQADLWGGLAAARQAVFADAQAEQDAFAEHSLALSLEIGQTYYELIEQALLQELVFRQITTNTQVQDLLLLGFANGTATSIDVLQQKELLASVKAQLPVIEARRLVLVHRLQVLLARLPEKKNLDLHEALPALPPLSSLGIPADLLLNRPDLRRLQQEVASADYRVAEAIAERLPALRLGGSIGLSSSELLLSIFAEVLATLLDWDQNKNKVEQQQAKVQEKMAAWSQAYLEAIEEVENSLSQEQEQGKVLLALEEQQQVAKSLLEQVQRRYLYGQTDYLPVLSALASVQKLERALVRQQRLVLSYRLQLYHALGGRGSSALPPPSSSVQ